jgi:sugar phosphate isomerase/epimerase
MALCDISVRTALEADYAGTLRAIAQIGYTHFSFRLERYRPTEAAEPPPSEKARMAADAGLRPGVARFANPAHLDRYLAETNAVGSKILALTLGDIFLPRADNSPLTLAMVDDFATRLDGWGARARAAGVTLAYHNHAIDGKMIDGVRPFDRILERTDPRNVAIELDLAWTYAGGYDIVRTVRELGPRLVSMHWKDYDSKVKAERTQLQAVELGAGELGLKALLPQIVKLTSALPGIEIENSTDEIGAAARAFQFISEALSA